MSSSKRPELKSSDVGDEAKFMSFIKSLGKKDPSTIRVFERPDYYSAHGEDALFIAQSVYRTTSVLKYMGGNQSRGLPYCTMNNTVFGNFLKDGLLSKALKVEIYSGQGRNGWKLSKQVRIKLPLQKQLLTRLGFTGKLASC
jgi:DNA mismatch repair protein MSH2